MKGIFDRFFRCEQKVYVKLPLKANFQHLLNAANLREKARCTK